jgi:Domain of unknown function (DUF4214)
MIEIKEPEINVETLMAKIREGAARAHAANSLSTLHTRALAASSNLAENAPSSTGHARSLSQVEIQPLSLQPEFQTHADDLYHVNDLLKYHDRNFIQNAYLAILKRGPDATGYRAFIESLRAGRLNKIDILARLRYSSEGRAKKVQIEGLLLPALVRYAYRVPLLGYLLRLSIGLARLPSMIRYQQQFEAHVLAQQELIADYANSVSRHLSTHASEASALFETLASRQQLDLLAHEQQTLVAAHAQLRDDLHQNLAALNRQTETQLAELRRLQETRLAEATARWQKQIEGFETRLDEENNERQRQREHLERRLAEESNARREQFDSLTRSM